MSVWNRRIFEEFLLSHHLFWYFNRWYIPWTVAQTPINHTISLKSVMRTFWCMYENCFNNLDFLLKSAQNCKKCTFLDNLHTITQIGNMETRQMTPIFLLFLLYLFVTFIFLFENSQNLFCCGSPSGPFWSLKYLNFGQKLLIRTIHTFLESRHPEVTKNPNYVLSREWSQKKLSAHGLVGHCAHSCRPPDGNKPFSKKCEKRWQLYLCRCFF